MSNAALILSQLGAPFNPVQSMGRAAALRNLQNRNQLEQQDMQFNQAKLDEIARANQDRNAIQSAAAGAYQTPAPVTPQMPPVNIGGTTLPGVPSSTVQGPAQFDRNAFSQALPPQLRMQADSQFAAEDRQKQSDAIKQQLDQIGLHEKLMSMDKQQRDQDGRLRAEHGPDLRRGVASRSRDSPTVVLSVGAEREDLAASSGRHTRTVGSRRSGRTSIIYCRDAYHGPVKSCSRKGRAE
jgi:hypothetical protein